jgi:hypothetical protein
MVENRKGVGRVGVQTHYSEAITPEYGRGDQKTERPLHKSCSRTCGRIFRVVHDSRFVLAAVKEVPSRPHPYPVEAEQNVFVGDLLGRDIHIKPASFVPLTRCDQLR